MQDLYNREIDYLRISLTEKCNQKCIYCIGEKDINYNNENSLLTVKQIKKIVSSASKLGIKKIRFTGGEPLLRGDISEIIKDTKNIKGIETVAITTNGVLLGDIAEELKNVGLDSINISLDTLDKGRYKYITGTDNLEKVIFGIESASKLKFKIKINVVIIDNESINELNKIKEYAESVFSKVQTIKLYNLNEDKTEQDEYDRPAKCKHCDRIRLLSNGCLLSCLHSDILTKINFKTSENIDNEITKAIKEAIIKKPKCGHKSSVKSVSLIGG